MTAPAAQIQRQPLRLTPQREAARAASAAAQSTHGALQNARSGASFGALLERGTPPRPSDRPQSHPPVRDALPPQRSPLVRPPGTAARLSDKPAEPAATGKTLPDKRQAPAGAATGVVRNRLETEPAAVAEEAAAADTALDAPTSAAEASNIGITALALLLAAPTTPGQTPAPALQSSGQPSGQTTAPGQITPGQINQGLVASATPPAEARPATAPATTLAPPAMAFVLEQDGSVADASKAAPTEPNTGAVQAAARAEPSTLAALTGTPEPGRSALHKASADAEAALAAAPTPAADTEAAALALAQPATSPPGALQHSGDHVRGTASDHPAEGIGFDALVDSIARAREGAADGGSVAVAMRHAEFGRISMRFQTDADGMSVAMTSLDPAFAPAVAAAHAAEAAEAGPRSQQSAGSANPGGDHLGRDALGSQAQGGTNQDRNSQQQPRLSGETSRNGPGSDQRGSEPPAGHRRSGIFA